MFRFDRFITLYLAAPIIRIKMPQKNRRIPILMYHSISKRIETVHPYFQTHTSPSAFAEQMRYLKENNYTVIRLEKAVKLLGSERIDTRKMVVITFDDGFLDFYTHAAPILKQYGFTATVFLPAGFITDDGGVFNGIDCLNWTQVTELMEKGFDFGSHTMTHPQLFTLNRKAISDELKQSKEVIEARTGKEVKCFSYPYAFPDNNANFISLMELLMNENGYKLGVTTRLGRTEKADAPFFLKRLPVNGQDDQKLFDAKLNGSYDWLYLPQAAYKKITRLFTKQLYAVG